MAAPSKVPWTRLIRFISAEDGDDQIYFGDAIVPTADFDIGDPANHASLTARVVTGDPLLPTCQVTDRVLRVKKLLGPLTYKMVPSIRCIGGNYVSHQTDLILIWGDTVREIGVEPLKYPAMFSKTSNALAGYGDDVELATFIQDDQADYEGELAFVIAKDAKNVSQEDAMDFVLGYTCANDVSARKWAMDPNLVGTFPPPQMTYGKSFDGFCPVGPCIVSADILKDPHALALRTKVNGELRQQSTTAELHFKIPALVEFLSRGSTLHAGSIVLTGTPGGVGFSMKPPRFLKEGDAVEIYFGGIGTLRHGITHAK
ncbi:hypothetical protein AYO20_04347 [Fonsecaea nubica]|uniref:Fumarylacetoacetase-like C-terminal domain-containing protein n=1 Tax=Fonsecaea nubica TaxID=856822 RepID=A0A178D5G4_9EURO|nr:hypothetical protein AYO20_04347 [Fonsecaea nubica]OAL36451.1 hypothetical protein AYO20_04347 [Fonsecaea nubica]